MKRFYLLFIALSWCIFSVASRHQVVLISKNIAKPDTVWIFTPESSAGKACPVVYMLHGWSGNYHQWDDIMNCQQYADRYGFILVCPDGLYDSWYINSPSIEKSRYADFFFNELMPYIRENYSMDERNVFITGLSMGGHGALHLFSQKPEIFRSAGSLSGVVDLRNCREEYGIPRYLGLTGSASDDEKLLQYSAVGNLARLKASGKQLIISCGTGDRFFSINNEFKAECDKSGIKTTYITAPGGHDYDFWTHHIDDQLKFFYKQVQHQVKEVLIMHHSHLDVGFTHLQPVAMELQKDFISQALDLLDRTAGYPEDARPKWTCEVTEPVMRWLEDATENQIKKFGEYLKQGRIVISALEYNTTPLASSEGLARQLYDAGYLSRRFGVKINTANLHDATGLPWPIVDLLKDAGVELLTMAINLHLSGTPKPRPAVYRWQSPGGRELLVMNGEHYSMFNQWTDDYLGNLDTVQAGLNRYLSHVENIHYPYDFVYLTATCAPYAYDNSPPDFDLPDLVKRWNDEGREPRLRFVTPHDLLERIRQIPEESIPLVKGDWTDFWNFGSSSSANETQISLNTVSNIAAIDLLAAFQDEDKQLDHIRKGVWDNINFYHEHTWGAWNPLDIHHPFPTAQWNMKAHAAYEGMALSKFALTRYLQQLAGNPKSCKTTEGILLVNPTASNIKVYPRIPADWFVQGKRIELSLMGGAPFERMPTQGKYFSPVILAPFSWKRVPFATLKEADPGVAIITGNDFIETAFYRLAFNPTTGKITSLYDKKNKYEVLDTGNEYGFFQFVHEKPDPAVDSMRSAFHVRSVVNERYGVTGWKPMWKALYSTIKDAKCRIESDPFNATLVISSVGEGTHSLEQRITLHADSPLIDLSAEFLKTENVMPEGIYFVFPLHTDKGWKGFFDTGDVPVELDREQLAGSCHDWVTVSSFAGIFDQQKGAVLYCPEAPMVMFGGFNFGRNQASIKRNANPMLLAWATNNYWETNFRGSQPGLIKLRYAFSPKGLFDASAIAGEAQSVLNPVVMHPVSLCEKESSGQFVKVSPESVRATYVKKSEDKMGRIIRLVNLSENTVESSVELSGVQVTGGWKCTTTEEKLEKLQQKGSSFIINLQPRTITSIRIE